MMRKLLMVIFTVLLVLAFLSFLGFIYFLFYGNPFLRNERIGQVEEHIVEYNGSLDNIDDIDARWLSSRGDFDINVVYKDEPELTYVYLYSGGIILDSIFDGEPFRSGDRLEEGKNGSIEEEGNS
ncbi:DUF3139 domain-containing protein [Alkalihalobacillus sp. FSL W8-0930]